MLSLENFSSVECSRFYVVAYHFYVLFWCNGDVISKNEDMNPFGSDRLLGLC